MDKPDYYTEKEWKELEAERDRKRAKERRARPNGETKAPEFSEDSLALRFAELHADKLRYCASWGKWLAWTGTHWEFENTLAVFDMSRKIAEWLQHNATNLVRQKAFRKQKSSSPSKCSRGLTGESLQQSINGMPNHRTSTQRNKKCWTCLQAPSDQQCRKTTA